MTKKELKRLRRSDLLELLLKLRNENDSLKEKVAQLEAELADRTIQISSAGSIAEAALQLNAVYEHAQAACDQYIQNIQLRCNRLERETKRRCQEMLAQAKNGNMCYEESGE